MISDKKSIYRLLLRKFAKYIPDEVYLRQLFKVKMGYDINIDNPLTFNEKLTWLKLNYHNPILTLLADKYWVKHYVASKIGPEYVVPCYGHWRRFEEIPFEKLPDRCFLKSNQDSGGGILYDKKAKADMEKIRKRFSQKNIKKKNWFWQGREWAYKNIEPCILAEEYLDEGTGHELQDYKFWCFNGKPIYMYITNKGQCIKENFYDMSFSPVNINHGFERVVPEFEIPDNFEKMKELSSILSEGLPFVRVDFFNVKGKVYFGECTFYDWGGLRPFASYDTDLQLGSLIDLSIICEK